MADPTIKYVNKAGEFHQDIPSRDLSADDYNALPIDLRAVVRDSPLYDYAGYKDKVQAAKDAAKQDSAPASDAPKQADAPKADAPAPFSAPQQDTPAPKAN